MNFHVLLAKPAAVVPPLMSLVAIMIALGHVALPGTAPAADEGSEAHMFQLIIVAQ